MAGLAVIANGESGTLPMKAAMVSRVVLGGLSRTGNIFAKPELDEIKCRWFAQKQTAKEETLDGYRRQEFESSLPFSRHATPVSELPLATMLDQQLAL